MSISLCYICNIWARMVLRVIRVKINVAYIALSRNIAFKYIVYIRREKNGLMRVYTQQVVGVNRCDSEDSPRHIFSPYLSSTTPSYTYIRMNSTKRNKKPRFYAINAGVVIYKQFALPPRELSEIAFFSTSCIYIYIYVYFPSTYNGITVAASFFHQIIPPTVENMFALISSPSTTAILVYFRRYRHAGKQNSCARFESSLRVYSRLFSLSLSLSLSAHHALVRRRAEIQRLPACAGI